MASTDLVADEGLLDGCEVLQGRKKAVAVIGNTNVFDEANQFIAQGGKNFVLIFDRL